MPMRTPAPWGGRRRMGSSDLMSQFEEFINEFDRGLSPSPMTRAVVDFAPAVDMEESDKSYLLSVDLPGMKKNEIKLEMADNVLTISGERIRDSKGEGRYSERAFGKFQRSFSLPVQVNSEKIEAHFEEGVLRINLPKIEGARSHSIKIM